MISGALTPEKAGSDSIGVIALFPHRVQSGVAPLHLADGIGNPRLARHGGFLLCSIPLVPVLVSARLLNRGGHGRKLQCCIGHSAVPSGENTEMHPTENWRRTGELQISAKMWCETHIPIFPF